VRPYFKVKVCTICFETIDLDEWDDLDAKLCVAVSVKVALTEYKVGISNVKNQSLPQLVFFHF
jgi:hypothetical protein